MSKLEISKEKVLEAASKCPDAARTLKILFPEAFKEEKPKYFVTSPPDGYDWALVPPDWGGDSKFLILKKKVG